MAALGAGAALRLPTVPDRRNALSPVRYGDPINLADASTRRVNVQYDGTWPVDAQYAGPVPYPEPLVVEDGFDQHAVIVDVDACAAYELIGASTAFGLRANGGARWDLRSTAYLPGAHAVTAPGLPLLGFLLRADEVRSGEVDHPLSFVLPAIRSTDPRWPARRTDGTSTAPDALPMGAWLRLQAGVDTTAFPPAVRTVAEALKAHGAVLADSGGVAGALVFNVEKTERFVDAAGRNVEEELASLSRFVNASDLEVVDVSALQVSPESLEIR